METYRFIQLDVFTQEPFAGNSLAVFPEAEGLTDEEMMKIAREMNLSETVLSCPLATETPCDNYASLLPHVRSHSRVIR